MTDRTGVEQRLVNESATFNVPPEGALTFQLGMLAFALTQQAGGSGLWLAEAPSPEFARLDVGHGIPYGAVERRNGPITLDPGDHITVGGLVPIGVITPAGRFDQDRTRRIGDRPLVKAIEYLKRVYGAHVLVSVLSGHQVNIWDRGSNVGTLVQIDHSA